MAVDTQHPDYVAMLPKWKRCRDTACGQDAVHAAGPSYLPTLTDQSPTEYTAYVIRTPFYNATYRTIAGLNGMLFRKPPTVLVPTSITPMLDNIDLAGTPLQIFTLDVSEEALTVGRVGIFVDYPVVDTESLTAADAISLNLRPMLKSYNAESIINWKTKTVNNATVLSMVVLQESHDVEIDEFKSTTETRYRVLDLIQDIDGVTVYRVRIFIVNDKKEDVLLEEYFPIINGKNPDSIPFYFIGVDDVTSEVDDPPLIDLVDLNLSHYRTNADYEHGCHFTGLPTPVISGYTPETTGEKFFIGSMTAWVFPRPDARATYLEFTGEGLGSLEKNLTRKEQQMAILGARMLEQQVKAVESSNTAAIHRGGEQSTLASMAQALSIGIQRALTTFCSFANADTTNVKFDLNRDFFPMSLDALTLTALVAGWQNGAYSYTTLFNNLKQGEIIDVEQTVAQEVIDIANQENKPIIPAGTKVNQSGTPIAHPTQRQLQTP